MNTKILGTGSCVPDNIVTNDDLAKTLDTSDEWISTRTGIRRRRVAINETSGTLATEAAWNAIDNAGVKPDEIELIIVATTTPDYAFPNTACLVQKEIGAAGAMCFDVSAACTGFIYALSIAESYIQSGQFKKALVIGSEVMSTEVDWNDRSVCVLFGDGAGAVVIGADETSMSDKSICCMHSDGAKSGVLTSGERAKVKKGKTDHIFMNGQEVFKFAIRRVPESVNEVLTKAGVDIDEVKYFVLHQANIRIIEAAAKRLGVSMERFPNNLSDYGNTSAASIPILLDELNREHKLQQNDLLVLSGFGAGLSWGSMLLRW